MSRDTENPLKKKKKKTRVICRVVYLGTGLLHRRQRSRLLGEERGEEEASHLTVSRDSTRLPGEESVCVCVCLSVCVHCILVHAVQECVRATELLSACLQSAFFTDKPDWELIRKMESKFGHKRQRALASARLREGQTQTPRGPKTGPPLRQAPRLPLAGHPFHSSVRRA